MDTSAQAPQKLKADRRPLYEQCRDLRITHDDIAAEAHCSRNYVVMYFSGLRSPRAVELAAEKLIARARASRRPGSNGRASRG